MSQGWIRLDRKILDNEMWLEEPFTRAQAWVDLLLLANHKDGSFRVRGNLVEVKRGEVAISEENLAKRWKWSRNKVRRYFSELSSKTKQQTEQQKSPILNKIRIINYDSYQSPLENETTDETTERQQTEQQKDTNKNDKNENNGKNGKKRKTDIGLVCDNPPTQKEVIEFFVSIGARANVANDFFDHYDAIGWTQGKNRIPLVSWQSAARRWKRTDDSGTYKPKPQQAELTLDQQADEIAARILGCR